MFFSDDPASRMAVRYRTVRYASIFAKKYGTLVRYVFFCKGTGTVRWYALSIKNPRLFRTLRWLFVNRGKKTAKTSSSYDEPTLNVWIEFADFYASDFKVT